MNDSPFSQLYRNLFRNGTRDDLTNYSFIRHIYSDDLNNIQAYLVNRKPDCMNSIFDKYSQLRLKCTCIAHIDANAQSKVLKGLILHQRASKEQNSTALQHRILPLLSHFISDTVLKEFNGIERSSSKKEHNFLITIWPDSPFGNLAEQLYSPVTKKNPKDFVIEEAEGKFRWIMSELLRSLKRCNKLKIAIGNIEMQSVIIWDHHLQEERRKPYLLLSDFAHANFFLRDENNESHTSIRALGQLACEIFEAMGFGNKTQGETDDNGEDLSDLDASKKLKGKVTDAVALEVRVPSCLSSSCRKLITDMSKSNISVDHISTHAFMDPSLPRINFVQMTKKINDVDAQTTPKVPRRSGNSCSDSEITLVSVLQRAKNMKDEESMERRKTPFGILRVPKIRNSGDISHLESSGMPSRGKKSDLWGGGYGTKGLHPQRQRLKDGRIEVDMKGNVRLWTDRGSITVTSEGNLQHIKKITDSVQAEAMYHIISKWVLARRRQTVCCTFVVSTPVKKESEPITLTSAICSVMANGPFPNYTVQFTADSKRPIKKAKDLLKNKIQLQIQVEQGKRCLTLVSSMGIVDRQAPMTLSGRQCILPLDGGGGLKSGNDTVLWTLSNTIRSSALFLDLSTWHIEAIEVSLAAACTVNAIFEAAMGPG